MPGGSGEGRQRGGLETAGGALGFERSQSRGSEVSWVSIAIGWGAAGRESRAPPRAGDGRGTEGGASPWPSSLRKAAVAPAATETRSRVASAGRPLACSSFPPIKSGCTQGLRPHFAEGLKSNVMGQSVPWLCKVLENLG